MEDLEKLVREILPQMGESFDTHDLILKLAQKNQRAYIRALQSVQGDAPFQTLHSMIGRTILKLAEEFKLQHTASTSLDIFRNENSCVLWTRAA